MSINQSQIVVNIGKLLFDGRCATEGVTVLGGYPLDVNGRVAIAQQFRETETDLLYVGIAERADGEPTIGFTIMLWRDDICFIHTGCSLYLNARDQRPLILPKLHVQGAFHFTSNEIIHGIKPVDFDAGIVRGVAWVRRMISRSSAS